MPTRSMPKHFRSYILLLSATWAIISFARLQPLQFSVEPLPLLWIAPPAAVTFWFCFRVPENWPLGAWFAFSLSGIGVIGFLLYFPIALAIMILGPMPSLSYYLTLGISAIVFWLAWQPAGSYGRAAMPIAVAALSLMPLLLVSNYASETFFPVRIEGYQRYGPDQFVLERRGYGGPVGPRMREQLIRQTTLPIPGLVWSRSLSPLPEIQKLTPTELILFPDRHIPLAKLTGDVPVPVP